MICTISVYRYTKECSQEREERKYENKFGKEYDLKRKFQNEKDEYVVDSYGRDFEKENSAKVYVLFSFIYFFPLGLSCDFVSTNP